MYKFIQEAHSGWAFLVLLTLVIAIINSLIGLTSKKEFLPKDRRIALFALIATHVQFVFGLVLYFVSPLGSASFGQMSNAELRLTSLEHPLINLIAIILITVGWSTHKKATDSHTKFQKITRFYAFGLLLILSRIPWNNWM